MLPEQRRRRILDYMTEEGAGDVPALAAKLQVSTATVRRDLQLLEQRGHIVRTHGGAVPNHVSTSFEPLHQEKAQSLTAEKNSIAMLASQRVNDGGVVVLDSGSTTLAIARALKVRRDLTIITVDLKIALELSDVPTFDVIMAAGQVRPSLYSVVGPLTENILESLHANHAFLGADAIDLNSGVTNANLEEVRVKQRAIAAAGQAVLVADHTKFGRSSLAKVADLRDFHEIITDAGLPAVELHKYREAGLKLTVAEAE